MPSVSLSQVLCRRQTNPNIQDIPSTKQTWYVAIPFLKAKNSGFVHFPIWSLDNWNEEVKKRLFEDGSFKKRKKCLINDAFIIFPIGVLLDQYQVGQGINCAFLKHGPGVQISFFPKGKSDPNSSSTI